MDKLTKVITTAKLIKSLSELSDILKKAHHEDVVAGVRVPEELHQHSEPVPHEHPHRDIASKFVLDVHRKNKYDGDRMAEKYLGIGKDGKILHPNALPLEERKKYMNPGVKKALTVQPAMVSSPMVVNNEGAPVSERPIVDSPNVMNGYNPDTSKMTKVISSMKRRK